MTDEDAVGATAGTDRWSDAGGDDAGSDAEGDDVGSDAEDGAAPSEREQPDGYVHRPAGDVRPHQAPPDGTFDWRGWVLVGVVLVAFLAVPAAILFLPQARGFVASLGLTLRDAYLVLPLVPAFLLGATAVWAALRSRSG
jgi:hypothetical protein